MVNKENIIQWLQEVEHPAKGDKNIVELGMVGNVEISGSNVTVTLGFAKHRDPLAEYLIGSAKAAIIRNAYCVGTVGVMDMGYNKGLSSWTRTCCLIYKNGTKQLINFIPDGKGNYKYTF
jgi:metal-sulfur cluster biosynthetic enzyme